jgi:hypothetical protein
VRNHCRRYSSPSPRLRRRIGRVRHSLDTDLHSFRHRNPERTSRIAWRHPIPHHNDRPVQVPCGQASFDSVLFSRHPLAAETAFLPARNSRDPRKGRGKEYCRPLQCSLADTGCSTRHPIHPRTRRPATFRHCRCHEAPGTIHGLHMSGSPPSGRDCMSLNRQNLGKTRSYNSHSLSLHSRSRTYKRRFHE